MFGFLEGLSCGIGGTVSSVGRWSSRGLLAALTSAGVFVALGIAAPSTSLATTVFSGAADLNYAGPASPDQYCSDPCLTSTYTTAGTVTVTVVSGVNSYLHFDVDLADDFAFIETGSHNTTFAFGLDTSGALISSITTSPTSSGWSAQSNVGVGDGIGTTWSYGLITTSTNANDLQFDVKASTNLTLENLIQTQDKHGFLLWFIADVSNPDGKTGFVGATTTYDPENPNGGLSTVPLPAAFPLFAAGVGAMGLIGWRRKARKGPAATLAA